MIRLFFISLIFFPSCLILQEKDSWIIDDIRISGLQRVSAGSVFAVMPVGLGEEIDQELFKEIASSIFQTGKFFRRGKFSDGRTGKFRAIRRPENDMTVSILYP